MCGIAGILQIKTSYDEAQIRQIVSTMTSALNRRGPDAGGVWVSASGQVALGHRRLSILDLSPEGAQPMLGPGGRFCLVFNGEIYNYKTIAGELADAGFTFRGHSDTEVLVTAIEFWGVEAALSKLVGMFAFAAWDIKENTLYLARDRLGEKPLYYGSTDDGIYFCSELKSLRAHPIFSSQLTISRPALSLYLQYGYVPDPYSIYAGVRKLSPGQYLKVPIQVGAGSGATGIKQLCPTQYWHPTARFNSLSTPASRGISEGDAVYQLDHLLLQAVSSQMVADVPLGAFLSGGIDSTIVVAAMQSLSSQPVKTFTIGFSQEEFNEARHAAAVAKFLGTEHTELYVTPQQCIDAVPLMPHVYDEPFADSSQIPTFLVSKLAKSAVTVSLSGDGGDELFCGYNRYFYGGDVARIIESTPLALRKALASVLRSSSAVDAYRFLRVFSTVVPKLKSLNNANVAQRMLKLSEAMSASSIDEMYRVLVSYWLNPGEVLQDFDPSELSALSSFSADSSEISAIDRFMLTDLATYLPGDNLVKVDRAAMYHSLETRVPLLDYRIVEYALSLPVSLKYRNGSSKWLLRQVLNKYVPRELVERPKMGFSVPVAAWLQAELRDWAEDLLSPRKLAASGVFKEGVVRRYWHEFQAGREEHAVRLWPILMYQAWSERL